MDRNILIGIDGGASNIRVAVSDLNGNLLSHIKWDGGAAIQKNVNAKENMNNAVTLALESADVRPEQVAAIAAGISGYDSRKDLSWIENLIDIEALSCPKIYVNDAVIAHIGAFGANSGIIAICGTGSVVFGMNENGEFVRNYDLNDYAYSASRHLTQNFINRTLKHEYDSTDEAVVAALLKHFDIPAVSYLSEFSSEGKELNNRSDPKLFGNFAKFITEGALNGSVLSRLVCNQAALEVCNSIELVSNHFNKPIPDVALVGSVANSKYIFEFISNTLSERGYRVKKNIPLPEVGALLLSMKSIGIVANEVILNNLIGEYNEL